MPKFKNETQNFRHRGFEDLEHNLTVMIYGDGPEPVDSQGKAMKKLWDHDVTQTIEVIDHA